jgi:hypothetical protein
MPIILFHITPILSPGASMQEGLYLSLEKEEEEGEGEIRVRPILPFPPERPLSSSYVSFLLLISGVHFPHLFQEPPKRLRRHPGKEEVSSG